MWEYSLLILTQNFASKPKCTFFSDLRHCAAYTFLPFILNWCNIIAPLTLIHQFLSALFFTYLAHCDAYGLTLHPLYLYFLSVPRYILYKCTICIYVEFGVVVIKLRSTRGSNCSSRAELARLESCNYCLKC